MKNTGLSSANPMHINLKVELLYIVLVPALLWGLLWLIVKPERDYEHKKYVIVARCVFAREAANRLGFSESDFFRAVEEYYDIVPDARRTELNGHQRMCVTLFAIWSKAGLFGLWRLRKQKQRGSKEIFSDMEFDWKAIDKAVTECLATASKKMPNASDEQLRNLLGPFLERLVVNTVSKG